MNSFTRQFAAKAVENRDVAVAARAAGSVNAATNRLYYSIFQAICALLHHERGFRPSASGSHKELLLAFAEWRRGEPEVVGNREANIIPQLKNLRIQADYKPTLVDAAAYDRHQQAAIDLISRLLVQLESSRESP